MTAKQIIEQLIEKANAIPGQKILAFTEHKFQQNGQTRDTLRFFSVDEALTLPNKYHYDITEVYDEENLYHIEFTLDNGNKLLPALPAL